MHDRIDGGHASGAPAAAAPPTQDGAGPPPARLARLRAALAADRPLLCVIVDTEEAFDWSRPLSRANRSVADIHAQARAHDVFAPFGIVPTYVVDYPVATDPEAAAFLRACRDAGVCCIGAHCHPWVNPPETEAVTPYTSYHGNLPAPLERAKLTRLTEAVADAFGARPTVYKAGRYGLGPNTPTILRDLGYRVDASVVPHTRFTADGGPDFTHVGPQPGPMRGAPELLELPLSVGFAGALRRHGPRLYPHAVRPAAVRLRLPGVLARTGLLERIRLTPEGVTLAEQRRLTRCLLADGVRVLGYSYHSPSLVPGNTPYVRTRADRDRFLAAMRGYFAYVVETLGGEPVTPLELDALWRARVPLAGRGRAQDSALAG